jgi:hypothetical protein
MKAFLEVTEWTDTQFNCNHVYWMDDSKNKMHAYARWGNPNDTQTFTRPIQIDARGRKFVEVRNDIYGWADPEDTASVNPTWTVEGSKGNKYIVEKDGDMYNCTCSGFKFRGACRHIEEVQNNG